MVMARPEKPEVALTDDQKEEVRDRLDRIRMTTSSDSPSQRANVETFLAAILS